MVIVVMAGAAGDVPVSGQQRVVKQQPPQGRLLLIEGGKIGVGYRFRRLSGQSVRCEAGCGKACSADQRYGTDMNKTANFFTVLAVAIASPAWADVEDARDLMEANRFDEAMAELLPAARSGNADAEELIGIMYAMGLGVERDDIRAFDWYLRSALKGHPGAQSGVGWYYEVGRGLPAPDLVRAYMWYVLSAIGGDPDAAMSQEEVVKKMTPEQIAKAHELVEDYRPWLYPFR